MVQVTLFVKSTCDESEKIPVALKLAEVPYKTVNVVGETLIDAKLAFETVNSAIAVKPSNVATIEEVPALIVFTSPLLLYEDCVVATNLSEDDQAQLFVRSIVEPSENVPVTEY